MRQNKIQKERTNQRKLVNPTKKEWYWHVAQFGVGCLLLFFAVNVPVFAAGNVDTSQITGGFVLWSSIFVTLMANKIGGLQFGIYRNCQISSRVFHTAVAALPLTKANRSDFE